MVSSSYERIYAVVKRIPRGRVSTYGQVARLAKGVGARQVGYALHALPDGNPIPWHRVINAKGQISPRFRSDCHITQRLLLEAEGIVFNSRGQTTLQKYQWQPKPRSAT